MHTATNKPELRINRKLIPASTKTKKPVNNVPTGIFDADMDNKTSNALTLRITKNTNVIPMLKNLKFVLVDECAAMVVLFHKTATCSGSRSSDPVWWE